MEFEYICTMVPAFERYPLGVEDALGLARLDRVLDISKTSSLNASHNREEICLCMATSLTDHRWTPGDTLNIHFLGGSPPIRRKVELFSKEWTDHANLAFTFDPAKESHIRISFLDANVKGGGNWSRVGTDARRVATGAPTINLAINECMTDVHVRQVVLHEFGHAIGLGLVHEHSSPASGIIWAEQKVFAYYARTANWSEDMVRSNIFEKYDGTQTQFSEFDPDSIMLYHIPEGLTENGWSSKLNVELSEVDKAYAAIWYPYPAKEGTVAARTSPAIEVKTLHDDGVPDQVIAADGIMPGAWVFY